jgi:2-polyprenyl-6-methoxyphenol hydroxylase-like FAD-dependent oxidoreductase
VSNVKRVLIVGAGVAGLTLGARLCRAGFAAEIVEVNRDWSVLGLGIALLGPTLRALDQVGVIEPCLERGLGYGDLAVCNPAGAVVGKIEIPRLLGPGRPAAVGIMRPAFHAILLESCRAAGVPIRLGLTLASIREGADGVAVEFNDGSQGLYDLVVGADGAYSKTRALLLGDAVKPHFTGQAVWRATVPRADEVGTLHVYYGGPCQPGLNPVSAREMYIFLVENVPDNPRRAAEDLPSILRALLDGFGGPLAAARDHVADPAQIVYRPIESLLLPAPWHKGRVLVIGDAAHVATPHMASGAGMAIEDAVVLTELLRSALTLDEAFAAFMTRRFERCRMVVENSEQIGRWELNPGTPGADPQAINARTMAALAQPF